MNIQNDIGFIRPDLNELIEQAKTEYEARLGTIDSDLRRNTTDVVAAVQAGMTHLLHSHMGYISLQSNVLSAEAEYLERWGAVWGVSRKQATVAAGLVNFSGLPGSVVPAGTTLLRTSDNASYYTTAEAEIPPSGAASVPVSSSDAGAAFNCAPGAQMTIPLALSGVQSSAVVASITGGTDQEQDGKPYTKQGYRGRILDRIQTPPHGGSAGDYRVWALEYPGVTRAWVSAGEMGAASVTVRVLMDDLYTNGIPPEEVTDDIQLYIDERRPVTAVVYVVSPIPQPVDFIISNLSPNTPSVRAAVEAEIRAMLRREGAPGAQIPVSKIWEAVSVASGEASHTVTSPAGPMVPVTPNHLIVFGSVIFA
ncbi:baseplate J/gp47 family protein [Novispirillum itersonii]|uniref:baseplate J/gp47 family protein n=1 Tax=Novispirillum itersonii TaxID=189 RepID=UPI0009DBCE8B|nr:baseplate J/gp47 family protein [Novispirillum itersonii]